MAEHDPRSKAKALIEQALHEGTEEALRLATALAACRLIRKHNLLDTSQKKRARTEPFVDAMSDLFGDLFKDVDERVVPPAPAPPQPAVARQQTKPARDPDAKDIPVVDQRAFCFECGQRILRGKYATWTRGVMYHPTCYNNATEA